jgi:hypothetical protein
MHHTGQHEQGQQVERIEPQPAQRLEQVWVYMCVFVRVYVRV